MNNPYQAPEAELVSPTEEQGEPPYFVVSETKFLVMAVITFNLYLVYWFYRHWKAQQPHIDKKIIPAARGLFAIFFVAQLFKNIAADWKKKVPEGSWNHSVSAVAYIAITIISNLIDRFFAQSEELGWVDWISFLSVFAVAALLLPVQKRINLVCNDVNGSTNASFSWANWLWILPFAALWGMILFGFATILFPLAFE